MDDLPNEIIRKILAHLNYKQVSMVGMTNRYYYNIFILAWSVPKILFNNFYGHCTIKIASTAGTGFKFGCDWKCSLGNYLQSIAESIDSIIMGNIMTLKKKTRKPYFTKRMSYILIVNKDNFDGDNHIYDRSMSVHKVIVDPMYRIEYSTKIIARSLAPTALALIY